jgi:hypothetical protein
MMIFLELGDTSTFIHFHWQQVILPHHQGLHLLKLAMLEPKLHVKEY